MKHIVITLIIAASTISCSRYPESLIPIKSASYKQPDQDHDGSMADVRIARFSLTDYTEVDVEVLEQDDRTIAFQESFAEATSDIAFSLLPSRYYFYLSYQGSDGVVAGTSLCSEQVQADRMQTLKSGMNRVSIPVCRTNGEKLNADVIIQPVLQEPGEKPAFNAAAIYKEQCASCHGREAEGVEPFDLPLKGAACKSCSSRESFASVTAKTMPPRETGSCDQSCGEKIFDYIQANF
ncbi:c-type cytochrome [Pseudobacteriovorax antillogorgiicola]|uniref:Cytochrome C oxidase, cbb3-type, subunit III n=1 Tax=Pseudobacteriovorax antillogorgiicola TaxID=1513793 RepID=A0A1Y6CJI4_9BACT|nr:cytochrome c [Pseudobacteriovorax antillogorgiicola]TCS47928.1 cbb3-type cytochrome c oxidase subunit III [Pseudobacteriovorax antillogorgiicola]SMF57968.1 Cytochrome C oxidase, cbb3-type, subunit III [Pseudobacteriovorax antillogorgiicola]